MGSSMKWGGRGECVGLAQRQFLKSLADGAEDADFYKNLKTKKGQLLRSDQIGIHFKVNQPLFIWAGRILSTIAKGSSI